MFFGKNGGDEISSSQEFAGNFLIAMVLAWIIIADVRLYGWVVDRIGYDWSNACMLLIAVVFVVVGIWSASLSPIDHWFNEKLIRGEGIPKRSNIVAIVSTLFLLVVFFLPVPAIMFWLALTGCMLIVIPYCANIMCRYD